MCIRDSLRIVIGRDAGERKVEWSPRSGGEREVIPVEDALDRARAAVAEATAPLA